MWGRALLLAIVVTLCSDGAGAGAGPGAGAGVGSGASSGDDNQLKAGRAINVFNRFGYLSISMKVVPRLNDTDQTWLFREPTIDVFQNIDHLITYPRKNVGRKIILDGDFHLEFCDNLRQLLQAYFRDFSLERLERPWRAFTGSWVPELMARNLGINSSFVYGDHCYVLVRLSRFRESVRLDHLPNNVQLVESVAQELAKIEIGDVSSVVQFIKKYGTHYIASYVTGNSLYQVFVYKRSVYSKIKDRLKKRPVSELPDTELANYFSPWYAEHMGQIKAASGNKSVEEWANSRLRFQYYIFTFASLLKLHTDTALLKILNDLLQNEALLQVELNTLGPAFKNPLKRRWFHEVIDNFLKLWEVNM